MWPFTRSMASRTRPKSLSASRRRSRPALECLEEKNLLSVTFFANNTGTYAFDSASSSLRQVTPEVPNTMHEGGNGTLYGNWSDGTWAYDYYSGQWTPLAAPNQFGPCYKLSASRDNTCFAIFSSGTYEFNGSWHRLNPGIAHDLAPVADEEVYLSFNGGTYLYNNGTLSQITLNVPSAMSASLDGTLFGSYQESSVLGTWEYKPGAGWTKEYGVPAKDLVAISYGHYVGTFSDGTWDWNQNHWTELDPNEADNLSSALAGEVTLIGSFGSTYGDTRILQYQNGNPPSNAPFDWTEISPNSASLVG